VYTTDNDKPMKIAARIRTGTYAVNMYAFDPGAPFGGYKNSGIGRENGPEGIEQYKPTACSCPSATPRPSERNTRSRPYLNQFD
jgi:acyl-CoA reductase-like NAD-dependent aldehyde dehydrogenase